MKPGPEKLLRCPAGRGVRLIALRYLDDAAAALVRMSDSDDSEALHDFRVGLRRLRTTLRAYRPHLEGVPRRVRRRLREVADATNQLRDAQVALAWLRPLSQDFTARQRIGLRWLTGRIEGGLNRELPRALRAVRRSFVAMERKLRSGLAEYRRTVSVRGAATEQRFAAVAAATVIDAAKQLDQDVAAIEGPDDDAVHRARIAAKRLRYELEPVADALPAGAELIRRLRDLQDLLGELHDLVELEEEVRAALEAAAVARAGRLWELTLDDEPHHKAVHRAQRRKQNPGLLAIGKRVRARRKTLFTQLETDWLTRDHTWGKEIEAAVAPLTAPRRIRRARAR